MMRMENHEVCIVQYDWLIVIYLYIACMKVKEEGRKEVKKERNKIDEEVAMQCNAVMDEDAYCYLMLARAYPAE